MVYFIASEFYNKVITTSITSVEGEFIAGSKVGDEISLAKTLEFPVAWDVIDKLVIDISAVTESEEEIVHILENFIIDHGDIRIILLAPNKKQGSYLLSECVIMHIFDFVCAETPYEIKDLLSDVIAKPRRYGDVAHFRVRETSTNASEENENKKEENVKEEPAPPLVIKTENGKVLIGIAGAGVHVGVTHSCIQLASYLTSLGAKVAILECNPSGDFSKIRENYEEEMEDGKFVIQEISFFESVKSTQIPDIIVKSYDFFIVDFGPYRNCDRLTFEKSDVKLIIAGSKAWELDALNENVFPYATTETLSKYHYLFNHTEENMRKDIYYGMESIGGALFLPYILDPFEPSFPLADTILKDLLPEKKSKKAKKATKSQRKQGLLGGIIGGRK